MKYKLEFVKISSQHLFAGVGFGGNIFIVLNSLTNISDDDLLIVDMETNECVCSQPDLKDFKTNNCWEYYFEQDKISSSEQFIKTNSLAPGKIGYSNGDDFLYPENFTNLKNKFYKSFQLKPYIIDLLDDFYFKNLQNKITLGVQIRLTDMIKYHKVSGLDTYIKRINEILTTHPEIEQVFVSTDDNNSIDILKKSINKTVIYYEDMFRADSLNPHTDPYDRYNSTREYHKYKLALEGILEIFTLSKCNYMLKAEVSALSMVASILSENIKKVYKL
jgi:hypothetical protein